MLPYTYFKKNMYEGFEDLKCECSEGHVTEIKMPTLDESIFKCPTRGLNMCVIRETIDELRKTPKQNCSYDCEPIEMKPSNNRTKKPRETAISSPIYSPEQDFIDNPEIAAELGISPSPYEAKRLPGNLIGRNSAPYNASKNKGQNGQFSSPSETKSQSGNLISRNGQSSPSETKSQPGLSPPSETKTQSSNQIGRNGLQNSPEFDVSTYSSPKQLPRKPPAVTTNSSPMPSKNVTEIPKDPEELLQLMLNFYAGQHGMNKSNVDMYSEDFKAFWDRKQAENPDILPYPYSFSSPSAQPKSIEIPTDPKKLLEMMWKEYSRQFGLTNQPVNLYDKQFKIFWEKMRTGENIDIPPFPY